MKNPQVRKPIRRSILKHIYVNVVQIEYLLGLFAAFWMGAENYWLLGLFVLICLTLGYATSYLYWHLIDTANDKVKKRRPQK